MIVRYREGRLAQVPSGQAIGEELTALGSAVADRIDVWDLTGALEEIWKVARRLNA